jgi:hypothetical protein
MSCPVACFHISCITPSGSATTVIDSYAGLSKRLQFRHCFFRISEVPGLNLDLVLTENFHDFPQPSKMLG